MQSFVKVSKLERWGERFSGSKHCSPCEGKLQRKPRIFIRPVTYSLVFCIAKFAVCLTHFATQLMLLRKGDRRSGDVVVV